MKEKQSPSPTDAPHKPTTAAPFDKGSSPRFKPVALKSGTAAQLKSSICDHHGCTRCQDRHPNQQSHHVCCTKIQNLSVTAAVGTILDKVSLHIHCGEITAIIGRNGAGKTTFFKTLLGEIPHSGEIHFMKDSCACTSTPRFGYVPQQLAVDANSPVSVGDVVLASLSRRPVWLPPRKKDRQMVRRVLSVTQADALEDRRVCDLSGGELQRVLLALAIHPVPDILLLDEPVSGVDRAGLALFYQLVSQLRHTHDITILLISHDLDLVARYADKVVILDKKIVAEGTAQQVYGTAAFRTIFGEKGSCTL